MRAVVIAYGLTQVGDTAELLTSEMVTNAYLHTQGPAALRLCALDSSVPGVRVSVWDTDPYVPAPFSVPRERPGRGPWNRSAEVMSDSGRGLQLVRAYADSWGGFPLRDSTYGRDGKLLWFELRGQP
ncbi:ATP-binding protein [Streptomyces sp. NPDC046939]|uniref:ATP-binding protein n=1 Tax=Streptomyces sp. NPDC046939 TaxID=3155376 RepID=UPI0033D4E10A